MGSIDDLFLSSDVVALAAHVRRSEVSPIELGEAAITRIEALTPTLTQSPRSVGFYDMTMNDLDAYNSLWSGSVFDYPFNVSGQSVTPLPLGVAQSGLPISIQIVARQGDEVTLLAHASVLEQEMAWKDHHPHTSTTGNTYAS